MFFPGPVPGAEGRLHAPRRCSRTPSGWAAYRGPVAVRDRSPARCCWTSPPGSMGMDPVELRRRNLLRGDEMPYANPNGMPYERRHPGGDLRAGAGDPRLRGLPDASRREALAPWAAISGLGHSHLRGADRRRRRPFLRHRGRDDPDRADRQGERLRRRRFDRQQPGDHGRPADRRRARCRHRRCRTRSRATPRSTPYGAGTGGSRSGSMTAGAVDETAAMLRERIDGDRRAPARGVARVDMEFAEARAGVREDPETSPCTLAEIADIAYYRARTAAAGDARRAGGDAPAHRRGAPIHLGQRDARVHLRGGRRRPVT